MFSSVSGFHHRGGDLYETGSDTPIPSFIKEILLLIFNKVLYHSTAQSASTILRRNAAPCKTLEERTVGDSSGDCSARQMEIVIFCIHCQCIEFRLTNRKFAQPVCVIPIQHSRNDRAIRRIFHIALRRAVRISLLKSGPQQRRRLCVFIVETVIRRCRFHVQCFEKIRFLLFGIITRKRHISNDDCKNDPHRFSLRITGAASWRRTADTCTCPPAREYASRSRKNRT